MEITSNFGMKESTKKRKTKIIAHVTLLRLTKCLIHIFHENFKEFMCVPPSILLRAHCIKKTHKSEGMFTGYLDLKHQMSERKPPAFRKGTHTHTKNS